MAKTDLSEKNNLLKSAEGKEEDLSRNSGAALRSGENITIYTLVSQLKKSQREKLISGYDVKSLAKVFEDAEMMNTAEKFLECKMNVCRAARELYMHRNTLIYRINAIKRLTGLDLKDFNSAVTFQILHVLYLMR